MTCQNSNVLCAGAEGIKIQTIWNSHWNLFHETNSTHFPQAKQRRMIHVFIAHAVKNITEQTRS